MKERPGALALAAINADDEMSLVDQLLMPSPQGPAQPTGQSEPHTAFGGVLNLHQVSQNSRARHKQLASTLGSVLAFPTISRSVPEVGSALSGAAALLAVKLPAREPLRADGGERLVRAYASAGGKGGRRGATCACVGERWRLPTSTPLSSQRGNQTEAR